MTPNDSGEKQSETVFYLQKPNLQQIVSCEFILVECAKNAKDPKSIT